MISVVNKKHKFGKRERRHYNCEEPCHSRKQRFIPTGRSGAKVQEGKTRVRVLIEVQRERSRMGNKGGESLKSIVLRNEGRRSKTG